MFRPLAGRSCSAILVLRAGQKLLAHLRQGLPDEAGNVHLREAHGLAIWVCGRPSSKRMRRISRSRSGSLSSAGSSAARSSERSKSLVLVPDRLERIELAPRRSARSTGRHGRVGGSHLDRLEHLLRRGLQLLGDLRDARRARRARPVSRSMAPDIDAFSSCSARGTRMAQPLSRKWRLISPTTLGVA